MGRWRRRASIGSRSHVLRHDFSLVLANASPIRNAPGRKERRQRRGLNRRPSRPRADPRQFRAAAADPGSARPDPHAARADARDRPSHPADSGDAGGTSSWPRSFPTSWAGRGRRILTAIVSGQSDPRRLAELGHPQLASHARGPRRRVGRTLARPSSLPDRSASEDDRISLTQLPDLARQSCFASDG